eukprot:361887-Chlamydomonas_euryale.AAC.3
MADKEAGMTPWRGPQHAAAQALHMRTNARTCRHVGGTSRLLHHPQAAPDARKPTARTPRSGSVAQS